MKWMLRFAPVFWLATGLGFAQSLRAALVDSDCYYSVTNNVNPTSTLMDVNRDKEWDIRYCSPTAKTKTFTLVPLNGMDPVKLGDAGNAKAAELVHKTGKHRFFAVTASGKMGAKTYQLDSISLMK